MSLGKFLSEHGQKPGPEDFTQGCAVRWIEGGDSQYWTFHGIAEPFGTTGEKLAILHGHAPVDCRCNRYWYVPWSKFMRQFRRLVVPGAGQEK